MQFYLVWPVAPMLALRHGEPKKRIRRAALALAAVSALEMAILYDPATDPSRIYYGTDTRAFSLLLGAWLALVTNLRLPRALRDALHAALAVSYTHLDVYKRQLVQSIAHVRKREFEMSAFVSNL